MISRKRQVLGSLCQRRWKYQGRVFVSCTELCEHIAKCAGFDHKRTSWQVMRLCGMLLIRFRGEIKFTFEFVDDGKFRVIKEGKGSE